MFIYDIEVEPIIGKKTRLETYRGKTLLIVNTASKCGFSKQFASLQVLHEKYQDRGLVIMGFPCNQFLNQEPGSEKDIMEHCTMHYGVTFPIFKKTDVKGKNQHPLYKHLVAEAPTRKGKAIKWNFEKFLVASDGTVVARYPSRKDPLDFETDIVRLLEVNDAS
ncbi:MAG: glutathione peroxidase [Acholeplasmatales bacterium]|nr:MAG: glutathione peroxidase [Acholeplasmatales bacterium]